MRKLIYKYIALGLIATIPFASCTDFLEKVNPNEMSTDSFWKDNNDLEMGLTAVYNAFKHAQVLSVPEEYIRTDMCYPGFGRPNPSNGNAPYYLQTFNDASAAPNNKWQALYKGIFRANQVIEAYDDILPTLDTEEQQETANLILAQARFLRGLFYFYLHNSFNNGSVILYESVPVDEEDFYQPLQDESVIREFFMADLAFAYENLPTEWDAKLAGKVTKGAAAAVMGKAELYAENYDAAAEHFKDVIDNYNYMLTENINDNFSEATEFNSESILEIAYTLAYKSEINIWDDEQVSTGINYSFSPVGGWRAVLPSLSLTYAYRNDPVDKNDPRNWLRDENNEIIEDGDGNPELRKFSLRTSYSLALADDESLPYYQVLPGEAAQFNNQEYAYFRKHTNWETVTNERDIQPSQRSGINMRVIRLADVYLMYAEALIKGGTDAGRIDEALSYVNKVRHRSALQLIGQPSSEFSSADFNGVDYTAESLMEHLMYVERPLELSVEGHAIRHLDMRRWGITKERFEELALEEYGVEPYTIVNSEGKDLTRWSAILVRGVEGGGYSDFTEAAANYNADAHAYWPIPNGEKTANPNIN
ncbi:RagB/SusD family nutrient uptake outer membrane protein [Sediminitomix flava]|uniref:Putative outer membrane starch-binding protein n=1 Tax=Sediminitomix flava TaxID=379075 RepID=A0A315YY43_SEDFL|nr:RagB/SusD family nutrient uptake outer membrane protein [Sediminitomix flava]PWJ34983.1 putative outer membrane starch-binding protein [Sediminitomix flava]